MNRLVLAVRQELLAAGSRELETDLASVNEDGTTMPDFFDGLLDTTGFPPRWRCGTWTEAHGWLHILSDLGIWSAYFAIPCILVFFVLCRRDVPFRGVFWLFGAFILACGTTHLMEAIIFWHPLYRLAGVIKLLTAVVSWATVVALVPVIPRALAMRSPEELEREIVARREAENALQQANAELARQVEALRSSEERFRLLVDGTHDHALFMLDPGGRIASWNAGAERIKQYQAGEIVGQHFSCFYTAEDVAAGKPDEGLRTALAEGRYAEESLRVRKDGTRFWASVVLTALRDAGGNLRGFSKVTRDITVRKQAEEQTRRLLQEEAARRAAEEYAQVIERQREQLRVTLASIGDGVVTTDADGRVTFLNPVAEALTGWTSEDAAGQSLETIFPIINEKTRETAENPVARVLAAGQIAGLANHTVLLARDGTERPIDDSAAPIRDRSGQITGVVLVFRDVTRRREEEEERRRSAEQLAAAEARLSADLEEMTRLHALSTRLLSCGDHRRALDDVLENAIRTSKADFGHIQLYNPRTQALEIVVQRGFGQDFLAHFRRGRVDDGSASAEAMRTGERVIIEDVQVDPTYEPHRRIAAAADYRAVQATPLKSGAGTIIGMLSTYFRQPHRPSERDQRLLDLYTRNAADFLERLRVEEEVRKNQEIFRLVHTIAKIGHWEWNSVTDENKWSPEIQALYGLVPGTFEGTYDAWAKLIHPDDLPKAEEDVRRAMETGKYFTEFRVVWPDGSVHWLEARANVFTDSHDKPVRIMGVNMDVTERKQLEESLKEADRRKNEFLATLAHELRNPLAPIRNAVELMRRTEGDRAVVQQARGILERQVGHMVRLIDDLLDISRITSGKLQIRKERVQLAAVIRSAVEASRPAVDAQSHELIVTLPEEPIYLYADPTRLSQVISNLLNNACKYTEKGGHIWLTAARQDGDVLLAVRDTGIGIPAEHLPHLFKTFSQVAPAAERSQGGLGIGLALVQGLVELHGGSVEVRSSPGKGSEFTVRLPAAEGPAAVPARTTPEGQPTGGGVGLRILVADDNRDTADSLAAMLRLMGHEVQAAHDGAEALQAATTFRPDVALLDIGMPRLNGYEVARQIRREAWSRHMVLIASTGWGQEEDKRRATEAGFHYHLTKPVEPAALANLLEAVSRTRD